MRLEIRSGFRNVEESNQENLEDKLSKKNLNIHYDVEPNKKNYKINDSDNTEIYNK